MKHVVFLSLGSNVGDSPRLVKEAIIEIEKLFSVKAIVSEFYSSEPWGFNSENIFINCCVRIEVGLDPYFCLAELQSIEDKFLRVRIESDQEYQDRTLDIDIIYFGDLQISSEILTIPHPRMYDRNFVLLPLHDISPYWIDPVTKVSVSQLIERCRDEHAILLYGKK